MHIGDDTTEAVKGIFCNDTGGLKTCMKSITAGGVKVQVYYSILADRLAAVSLRFSPADFEAMRSAYVTKFGRSPDSSETEAVTTKAGAQYENLISTWNTADGPFVLKKYGSKVTEGSGILLSKSFEKFLTDREKSTSQDLSKAL